MISAFIIILGLIVFEVVSSVDNAIVNADVIKTLPERQKRFFLTWGLFLAVFVVRGVLPFLIIKMANPAIGAGALLGAVLSGDPQIMQYVEASKGLLLLGGGVYLVLVMLSWLFTEEKQYAFLVERFIHKQSVWFYAIAMILLVGVTYIALKINPVLALASSIGTAVYFITDGFKKNAEEAEKKLTGSHMSAWSKVAFLEVLDLSFSIDGVIGAFAFTTSIPLILVGNGIGAFVVREITIRGTAFVSKFAYLKNGAMYSIGMLGLIMTLEAFGQHYPFWLAPLNTFLLLGIFLFLSYRELKLAHAIK